MGLSTSHDCWNGSYTGFYMWRAELGRAAGYMMIETLPCNDVYPDIEWDKYDEEKVAMGKWDKTPEDPLIVLLVHSDCEGHIYPEQAGPLADRLEEILPRVRRDDWKEATIQFAAGLRNAAKLNEVVDFF